MVSDGSYHKAELLAIKKNFTLRVDDGPARSIINEGVHEYLRLDRPMFIGGVPEETARDAFAKWHLRNITSFKGERSKNKSYMKILMQLYVRSLVGAGS